MNKPSVGGRYHTEARPRRMSTSSRPSRFLALVAPLLALTLITAQTQSQSSAGAITPPQAAFGAAIGDDYFLATYRQLESYWKTLERESDRVRLVDIGRTEEGRSQWM